MKRGKPFKLQGSVNPEHDVYIKRNTDTELVRHLIAGTHCCIHSSRQAGKSSLMFSAMDELNKRNIWCVRCSFHNYSKKFEIVAALRAMRKDLMQKMAKEFNVTLAAQVDETDDEGEIFVDMLERLKEALPANRRLVLMFDELDSLLNYNIASLAQLFKAIKDWDNIPGGQNRVTLLFISVRTPTQMVMGVNANDGNPNFVLELPLSGFPNDIFTVDQIVNQGFPHHEKGIEKIVAQVLKYTNGQPHLTALLLDRIQNADIPGAEFRKIKKEILFQPRTFIDNHLDGVKHQLFAGGHLLFTIQELYQQIFDGCCKTFASTPLAAPIFLEQIGLIRANKEGFYELGNSIYKARLQPVWMDSIVSEYEKVRPRVKVKPAVRQSQKRIGLICTGGTVGMIISADNKTSFQGADLEMGKFIDDELAKIATVQRLDWHEPRDGINMTPVDWRKIANYIQRFIHEFDGFVVTHGTDTLAFTASAVAFMLGAGLRVPVVFTGAQTAFNILHGDTRDNLIRACYVAAHHKSINEVQVVFGDLVMRAVRVQKVDDRLFQGFDSPAWPPLARVTEYLIINNYALVGKDQTGNILEYRPFLSDELLLISLVPGLRPNYFEGIISESVGAGKPLGGIVITTPGVGNIPSVSPYNFRPLIQKAIAEGIPVLVASQVPINPFTQEQYEMARLPEEYGAILTGNLTFPAAFTKFSWTIGCVDNEMPNATFKEKRKEIARRMKVNYIGELGEYEKTTV